MQTLIRLHPTILDSSLIIHKSITNRSTIGQAVAVTVQGLKNNPINMSQFDKEPIKIEHKPGLSWLKGPNLPLA